MKPFSGNNDVGTINTVQICNLLVDMTVIVDDEHIEFNASSDFLTRECWRSLRRFTALRPTNSVKNSKKVRSLSQRFKNLQFSATVHSKRDANASGSSFLHMITVIPEKINK